MGKEGKSGQVNLSFGMIFSIILIVVFIAFAFYVIGKFLGVQDSAKTGQFIDALKSDINRMWTSEGGSQEVTYSLPKSVEYTCFADFNSTKKGTWEDFYSDIQLSYFRDENLFFFPAGSSGSIDSIRIDNIDLIKMTAQNNPYCIENVDGKISMVLEKGFGEILVTVTRK